MRKLLITTLMLVLGVSLAVFPVSRAVGDADPASDVLLGTAAFFPYHPAVSSALQSQILRELARLKRKGLNLKVAIIESPIDLGAIPNMFGHPRAYAAFLDREISFNQPQPLLVVMPSGFGLSHAGDESALRGIRIGAAGRSNGLTRTAIAAVQKLAQAEGKPITAGKATGGGSGGASPLITFGAPAILVLLGAAVAARLHRRGVPSEE